MDEPARTWVCPACGRKNQLFQFACLDCHQRLTPDMAARQGIGSRETGLPEAVQREFDAARQSDRERAEAFAAYLSRRRLRHAFLGAGILFLSQLFLSFERFDMGG